MEARVPMTTTRASAFCPTIRNIGLHSKATIKISEAVVSNRKTLKLEQNWCSTSKWKIIVLVNIYYCIKGKFGFFGGQFTIFLLIGISID